MTRETTIIRVDTIECPECGTVQKANVTHTEGDPFPAFVHWCEKCGYIVMESEWNRAEVQP